MPRPDWVARSTGADLRAPLRDGGRPEVVRPRGLRDEDWAGRHRLLTVLLLLSSLVLTAVGVGTEGLNAIWLVTVVLICLCAAGAVALPPRRLPSMCVAIGLTLACAGLVAMTHGLTEAHFSFFVTIAALALYRDWAPFGVCLAVTVAHHLIAGVLLTDDTFRHGDVHENVLFWVCVHGAAVFAAAAWQLVGWRLAEAEALRADADLSASRAQFEVSFDETPIPMAMLTIDGRLLRVNTAYRDWLNIPQIPEGGLKVTELPIIPVLADGETVQDPPPDPAALIMDRLAAGTPGHVPVEQVFRHIDGRIMIVEIHGAPIFDRRGQVRLIVTHCLDVTLQRQHEAELRRKVREDSLTGLLSRAAFEGDLLEMLGSTDGSVCVIYIDVDRFKAVNDSFGHSAGDDVLRLIAGQLQQIAPAGALVARLGGDEFAVAVPGGAEVGTGLGKTIVDSCRRPVMFGGAHLQATVSVGLSVTSGADQAEQAVLSADAAMYAAKQSGRNHLMTFDDDMRMANGRRIAAEMLLREALDGDRDRCLPVWFQPIVGLYSRRVVGAEALVRLRTSDGDVVSPGVFIPAAEETGLVVQIGEHVLRTALAQLARWGERLPYVSVNVSPRQLSEDGFLQMLERCLQDSGLTDRSKLVLEITETSMLSTSVDLTARLHAIKALGVRRPTS
jgi:diguanylate cyclase (GGDEF)-like protein